MEKEMKLYDRVLEFVVNKMEMKEEEDDGEVL